MHPYHDSGSPGRGGSALEPGRLYLKDRPLYSFLICALTPAVLRIASIQPNLLSCLSGSGCALRGWAEGPARKPGGSTNRAIRSQFKRSKPAGPTATLVAGLCGGRLRPAQLKEPQKLGPKHRPVSTSLRLRCRSAGAARHSKDKRIYSQTSPAAILAGLAECQPAEYAFLSGRATDVLRCFFSRACAIQLYSAHRRNS